MRKRIGGGIVYSTGRGSLCPSCGRPGDDCRCGRDTDEEVPERVTARLRVEKKGRAGKSVTVIAGLPRNRRFLQDLAHELKKACGTGGTAADGAVELQGDQREKLREILARKSYVVKG